MSKPNFPIAELVREARTLELGNPEHQLVVDDFHESTQVIRPATMSAQAQRYMDVYGPIMDVHLDLSAVPKAYQDTYRLACAATMHNIVRGTRQSEATLASTSLPTFTRQKLLLVQRLFPRLIAPQMFGFIPMAGPTARIHFRKTTYGSVGTGTPAIAVGDSIDDPSKQSKTYANHTEGTAAKQVTFNYLDLDISVSDKRIVGEWSDRLADEAAAVYDENAESAHLEICAQLLGIDIDRNLIDACFTAVPAANASTFDATPAGYESLSPSEQKVYDQNLYRIGFSSVLQKIGNTCRLNPEGKPNWVLTDLNGIGLCRKIENFTSLNVDIDSFAVGSGPVQVGQFTDVGLRVFVDPAFNAGDVTEAEFLFGRKPMGAREAAIYLGMWIPARVTQSSYNPSTGMNMKGVRSSYAIVDPDTNDEAESAQLARGYGKLTVTL